MPGRRVVIDAFEELKRLRKLLADPNMPSNDFDAVMSQVFDLAVYCPEGHDTVAIGVHDLIHGMVFEDYIFSNESLSEVQKLNLGNALQDLFVACHREFSKLGFYTHGPNTAPWHADYFPAAYYSSNEHSVIFVIDEDELPSLYQMEKEDSDE